MNNFRKAIHFDLDTNELKKIYKTNNPFVYLDAYKKIGKFLKSNGFTHRQWSGYISNREMSDVKISMIVHDLNNTFPWLKKCVRKFDVTNIGESFDLTYIFKQSAPPVKAKEKAEEKEKTATLSMEQIKENAAVAQEIYDKSPKQQTRQNKRSKNEEL